MGVQRVLLSCSPNEDLDDRTNIWERLFDGLFEGVGTRFGRRPFETCFEKTFRNHCSTFQNLLLVANDSLDCSTACSQTKILEDRAKTCVWVFEVLFNGLSIQFRRRVVEHPFKNTDASLFGPPKSSFGEHTVEQSRSPARSCNLRLSHAWRVFVVFCKLLFATLLERKHHTINDATKIARFQDPLLKDVSGNTWVHDSW